MHVFIIGFKLLNMKEERNSKRLGLEFYRAGALELAPLLLGKYLCRKRENALLKERITETECYCGEEDTACHAHRGRTKRTEIMYHAGGVAYVYLCYGIYPMLNIVAGREGSPEAVLIRSTEGITGPGRLTRAFAIPLNFNGENLAESDRLWVEGDGFSPICRVEKRIGINSATEEYKNKLWRFFY